MVLDTGLGLGTTDQMDPFQDSISVPLGPTPAPVHELSDTHQTLFRNPPPLGVARRDQSVPFHDSAMPGRPPVLPAYQPTAMHVLGETQDTLRRRLSLDPWLGLKTTDQLV